MLKKEWKSLLNNKLLLVVVLAIITIPTIYTTLFLGSMWDPYGNMDKLPVAVVNHDQPVTYNDQTLKVGEELVNSLKKEDSLCFNFVDDTTANRGLKNGTYYMVITIPENFSENASTLMDEKPQKMELNYATNPGTNYIASKMSETAMEKVKNSVAEEVTKTYTQTVFDQIVSVGDGMQEAADGTSELNDGVIRLADGNHTITDNLNTLADSSLTFKDGSNTLRIGLKEYTDGVSTADSGAATLNDGAAQLKNGIDQLGSKVPALSDGVSQLASGSSALSLGTKQTLEGGRQLKDGSAQVDENMSSLNAGLSSLQEQTSSLPESVSQLNAGAQALDSGAAQLQAGIDSIYAGAQQAENGAAGLNQGLTELDGRSAELLAGLDQVEQGIMEALEQMLSAAATQSSDTTVPAGDASSGTDAGYLSDALNEANAKSSDVVSANPADVIQYAFASYRSGLTDYTEGVKAAKEGSDSLAAGINGDGTAVNPGLVNAINSVKEGIDTSKNGLDALAEGTQQLSESTPALIEGITAVQEGGKILQTQGTSVLKDGSSDLYAGLEQVDAGSSALNTGTGTLAGSLPELSGGILKLSEGAAQLSTGTAALASGTEQLTANNSTLLDGADRLLDGAAQISSGASKLHDGSKELGNGIHQVSDGTQTLNTRLSDGAKQVKDTKATDDTIDMFASPVNTNETKITTVENNGHAMAPYMMSVALWVGCIAFSLMYPLTKYEGRLKSGFSWWLSKASVLYLIAVLQAVVMVLLLQVFDGFEPVEMGKTMLTACLASVAFMSVMYFFTNSFGKAGSFLMLIFMVIQLAGSVGTYPLELSGSFVPLLHDWVPFTYTVQAFRSTICGGESILTPVIFLIVLWVSFTVLTVIEFQFRARRIKAGHTILADWLEEKGLA